MRSIARQVIVPVLTAQVALVVCIISLLLLHERYTRLRALDARVQGRADSLAGAIQDSEDAAANVYVDPREFQAPAGDHYAVYGEDGSRIAVWPQGSGKPIAYLGVKGFRNVQFDGTSYRVKEQPGLRIIDRAETSGVGLRRPITIVYATPQAWVQHELAEATRFYVLAGVLTTAVVSTLLIWSLRRSLRPISELANAAAALQPPPALQFTAPPSVVQVSELSALASSLEGVVERVQAAFQKEQRFVSNAAHELKTAVAVVQSGLQVLLIRPREAGEYVAGVRRVLGDTDRLEDVVMQMLQSADIAESSPADDVCDLYLAAEKAVSYLAAMAEGRGVLVRIVGGPGIRISLPVSRAALLIENLVSNAIQHSPSSSEVTVHVRRTGNTQTLTVSDRGTGIRPESLPHVFERFYREDVSRSRGTGGTGLGLAICKAIVESAGGHISVESQPGQGASVHAVFTPA